MSFVNKFTAAMRQPRPAPVVFPRDKFDEVFDDLVKALEQMGVWATVRPSVDARRSSLAIAPANQPARAQLLLPFVFENEGVTIPGLHDEPMTEPEQLADALAKIIALPQFVESIEILRREAEAPVDARLRTSDELKYTDQDLLVEVTAQDQKTIAAAPRGRRLELDVKLSPFPGNGPFDQARTYLLLDSAGILLNVESISPAAGELKIRAIRA